MNDRFINFGSNFIVFYKFKKK